MCDITDAKRHIELAKKAQRTCDLAKAIESYVEAASIYLLQYQLTGDEHLLEHAQEYYLAAQKLRGIDDTTLYSKEELAKRTLRELGEPKHAHDVLEQIKQLVSYDVR